MTRFISLTLIVIGLVCSSAALANDTTFTYQGELQENGSPANGAFNIDFSLWDAISHGNQIGTADTHNNVPVVNGKFTVRLDFGASSFDNSDRWLEILVDGNTLSPRIAVSRSPYSIQTRGIFVDDNYNVGIGTTIPEARFHVQGDSATLRLENNSSPGSYTALREDSGVRTAFQKVNTSGSVLIDIDPIPLDGVSDATLRLFRSTNTTGLKRVLFNRGNGTTQTSALIGLDGADSYFQIQGGNVGIGTTTPDYKLHVQTSDETAIAAHVTNSEPGKFPTAISGTADGNFSIGVRGNGVAVGVSGHAIGTSGVNAGVYGITSSTGGRGVNGVANTSSGVNYGVYGQSNSPDGFDFYAIGAGEDYGSGSSRRWKSNIKPIEQPLEKISRLDGVYFEWDKAHGGHHDVGMVAEDVGEVLPEIVRYEANGIDALGMDYSKLTPLLVEAVKALDERYQSKFAEDARRYKQIEQENDSLRARIGALEQLVEQLASAKQEQPK